MRTGVEFLDLYCANTKGPDEDEVTLKFNGATLWSGPIRSGITRKIETIKVISDQTGIVELWQEGFPRRTINRLDTQTISEGDVDYSGTPSAQFTAEGAEYPLSYRFLQIPD
jgi:hypothetical protein